MKQLLLICAVVALVGCGTTSWVSDPSDPNNVKIEKKIRSKLKKPAGELTKADLEKVHTLFLNDLQLTDVKGLEKLTNLAKLNINGNQLTDVKWVWKLTKLEAVSLGGNPDITAAQIDELRKAHPSLLRVHWP